MSKIWKRILIVLIIPGLVLLTIFIILALLALVGLHVVGLPIVGLVLVAILIILAILAILALGLVVTKWVFKYLFEYKWYFKDMKHEFDKLEQKREMMQQNLSEANYLYIVEHDVEAWIERVYEIEKSVHKMLEEKVKFGDRFLNVRSRYRLAKKAEKITRDIVKLFGEGRSNTMAVTSQLSSEEHIVHISGGNPTKTEVMTQLNRRFTLHEVKSATHNFDIDLIIGKGGFGKVYKGFVDEGATKVAVKRLDPMSNQGDTEFHTEIEMLCRFRHCNLVSLIEIEMLCRFRHCNLVSLIGYCDEDSEKILVYEYMTNGSLADHLHPKERGRNGNCTVLCWVQRLKICIGAARAIEYLHSGTSVLHKVIHRDVKSANILLDENWAAKVSDFGLSKIGPVSGSCTGVNTKVKGTPGYCDPEYVWTRRLTSKSDVYAFGVVLFEVLSGKPALDFRLPKEKMRLAVRARKCMEENTIHELIDPNLKGEIHLKSLKVFVDIADKCLQDDPKKRPKMAEVVASLELALASQMSTDSSLLADADILDFHSTCDNQENVGSSVGGKVKINLDGDNDKFDVGSFGA